LILPRRVQNSSPGRLLWLSMLGAVFVVTIAVSASRADGCYVLDLNHPDNRNIPQQGVVLGGLGVSADEAHIQNALSVATLSRLAVLSGPFQSFQGSRIAKEPNCNRWGGRDKVRHAAIFFATTLGLQLFIESTFNVSKTKAFLLSAALATAVGFGKELYDWKISDKDCFSEQDLLANTGGILSAGLVIMISN